MSKRLCPAFQCFICAFNWFRRAKKKTLHQNSTDWKHDMSHDMQANGGFSKLTLYIAGGMNQKWPQLHIKRFNIIQHYNAVVKQWG